MFQRKPRRFRRNSNDRNHLSHGDGYMQTRPRSNSFSNNKTRNNFRTTQSAEKMLEKYNSLAKEAMSSGDRTLGENYLQHADHFMRIIEEKNKFRDQNKVNTIEKSNPDTNEKSNPDTKSQSENNDAKQENVSDTNK